MHEIRISTHGPRSSLYNYTQYVLEETAYEKQKHELVQILEKIRNRKLVFEKL